MWLRFGAQGQDDRNIINKMLYFYFIKGIQNTTGFLFGGLGVFKVLWLVYYEDGILRLITVKLQHDTYHLGKYVKFRNIDYYLLILLM